MSINSSSGVLTLNSAPDYETKSSYSATVTASDGTNSSIQNITVNLTNVNDNTPSITSSSTFNADENQTAIGTVTATDADGDTLSYSIQKFVGSNTDNAFPLLNDSSLDETDFYTTSPTSDQDLSLRIWNIDDDMKVTLKNADGSTAQEFNYGYNSGTHNIDIDNYISANGSTIDLELTNTGGAVRFNWQFSIDNQVIFSNGCQLGGQRATGIYYQAKIYLGSINSDISINSTTGALTFDTAPDYETKTSYTARVTASDGTNSATQDITVNVTNLNDNTPSLTSGATFNAAENQTAIGTVTATDADGDTISYSLSGTDASSMSINSSRWSLSVQ